jgi:regulator of RNase E activity RraA
LIAAAAALAGGSWLLVQSSEPSVVESFCMVEVGSVSDAMEQLYGQRAYKSHDMRPLAPAEFAGPAVTVQLKKEEHKEGSAASQGMLTRSMPRRRARST